MVIYRLAIMMEVAHTVAAGILMEIIAMIAAMISSRSIDMLIGHTSKQRKGIQK